MNSNVIQNKFHISRTKVSFLGQKQSPSFLHSLLHALTKLTLPLGCHAKPVLSQPGYEYFVTFFFKSNITALQRISFMPNLICLLFSKNQWQWQKTSSLVALKLMSRLRESTCHMTLKSSCRKRKSVCRGDVLIHLNKTE